MPRCRHRHVEKREGVGDFRRGNVRPVNNPPAGPSPTSKMRERRVVATRRVATTLYVHDPHLDSRLRWMGKVEHTSFEGVVVSPHIHERISTRAIPDAVRCLQAIRPGPTCGAWSSASCANTATRPISRKKPPRPCSSKPSSSLQNWQLPNMWRLDIGYKWGLRKYFGQHITPTGAQVIATLQDDGAKRFPCER